MSSVAKPSFCVKMGKGELMLSLVFLSSQVSVGAVLIDYTILMAQEFQRINKVSSVTQIVSPESFIGKIKKMIFFIFSNAEC